MLFSEGLADIGGTLNALQTASNIVKNWTSAKSDSEKQSKLSELGAQILAAQTSAINANAAQSKLVDEISSLKAEITRFEKWDVEAERYQLRNLTFGTTAYVLKKSSAGGEPPHWICPTCYQGRKRSILQSVGSAGTSGPDLRKIAWKWLWNSIAMPTFPLVRIRLKADDFPLGFS